MKCSFDGVASKFSFRVRDMTPDVGQSFDLNLPQGTGMTSSSAFYGPLEIGSRVIIHRHRPVRGDDNWRQDMNEFIGREGVVAELRGVDDRGCPVVRCSFGGRTPSFVFRIRDMTLIEEPAYELNLPQNTGMTNATVYYGPLKVGSKVIIHRHRPVGGDANWGEGMNEFIGKEGVVTELRGVDEKGCAMVKCSFSGRVPGCFFRIRDLTFVEEKKPEPAQELADSDPDSKMCKICYEKERNCVLVPCGHLGLCFECAKGEKDRGARFLCPFCRKPVLDVVKVFYC